MTLAEMGVLVPFVAWCVFSSCSWEAARDGACCGGGHESRHPGLRLRHRDREGRGEGVARKLRHREEGVGAVLEGRGSSGVSAARPSLRPHSSARPLSSRRTVKWGDVSLLNANRGATLGRMQAKAAASTAPGSRSSLSLRRTPQEHRDHFRPHVHVASRPADEHFANQCAGAHERVAFAEVMLVEHEAGGPPRGRSERIRFQTNFTHHRSLRSNSALPPPARCRRSRWRPARRTHSMRSFRSPRVDPRTDRQNVGRELICRGLYGVKDRRLILLAMRREPVWPPGF
jgi:hypothetical protein